MRFSVEWVEQGQKLLGADVGAYASAQPTPARLKPESCKASYFDLSRGFGCTNRGGRDLFQNKYAQSRFRPCLGVSPVWPDGCEALDRRPWSVHIAGRTYREITMRGLVGVCSASSVVFVRLYASHIRNSYSEILECSIGLHVLVYVSNAAFLPQDACKCQKRRSAALGGVEQQKRGAPEYPEHATT